MPLAYLIKSKCQSGERVVIFRDKIKGSEGACMDWKTKYIHTSLHTNNDRKNR
jgi:hypothetical protein